MPSVGEESKLAEIEPQVKFWGEERALSRRRGKLNSSFRVLSLFPQRRVPEKNGRLNTRRPGMRRPRDSDYYRLAPTILRDLEGHIADWNCAAEKRYGFSRSQAVGAISHYLLRTIFPSPLSEINKELVEQSVWEGELIHTIRDGARVKVVSRWELYRDEDGACRVREINEAFVPVDAEQAQLAVQTIRGHRYFVWKMRLRRAGRLLLFFLPLLFALLLILFATHMPSHPASILHP